MNAAKLRRLLGQVVAGRVTPTEAVATLRGLPFEDLGFARVDHHRALRKGFPEVVFGQGKTVRQIAAIVDRVAAAGHTVLVTRTTPEACEAVRRRHPRAQWSDEARAIWMTPPGRRGAGRPGIAVLCAGTSDIPVAEEAALTATLMGNRVERIFDVGVAGLHRLTAERKRLTAARVLVVVAGMEGALPSVVAGLVRAPVIAVPTSVGYGAALGGFTALLGMLNSCSSGVTVVNIDNGFGAGYAAALVNAGPSARRPPRGRGTR